MLVAACGRQRNQFQTAELVTRGVLQTEADNLYAARIIVLSAERNAYVNEVTAACTGGQDAMLSLLNGVGGEATSRRIVIDMAQIGCPRLLLASLTVLTGDKDVAERIIIAGSAIAG